MHSLWHSRPPYKLRSVHRELGCVRFYGQADTGRHKKVALCPRTDQKCGEIMGFEHRDHLLGASH